MLPQWLRDALLFAIVERFYKVKNSLCCSEDEWLLNQVDDAETVNSAWKRLYRLGAVAALILLALFMAGVIGIFTADWQSTAADSWFAQFSDNWLVVLFKLNAGFSGVQLNVFNVLDLVVMALFCLIFLALYGALKRTNKVWSLFAASLPFLGIPVFFATGTAGRSTLLVGGLVVSVVMLRGKIFGKATACVGIVASALLFFAGDIATAIFSSSNVIAVFIGIGYALWMLWLFLIARRLFQLP